MLKGRNIVVKKIGDAIYLPTTEILHIEQPVNIAHKPYSMCRITDYQEESGALHLHFTSDKVDESKFLIAMEASSAALLSSNIKKLVFDNLSPMIPFSPSKENRDFNQVEGDNQTQLREYNFRYRDAQEYLNDQPDEQIENQITDFTTEIAIKDLKFELGKVTFEYHIQWINRKIEFEIFNPFIKREFDSIKNYFCTALETKKITVSIYVESKGREVLNQSATSPQINKIDDSIFEIVEELYVEEKFLNNSEDDIYNLNEKAEIISQEIGSAKVRDEDWLLEKLIAKARTKHYFHLRYLSSKHLKALSNLRITGKPISFIFLLPAGTGYSLIWETYSTEEATYVWKLNGMNAQQLQSEVQILIEIIKWLRKNNKKTYLRDKPENCTRIEHEYSGEDNGFKKWKKTLDELLVSNNR